MTDTIEKLDYSQPPVGFEKLYEAELAAEAMGRAPLAKHRDAALTSVWATYRNQRPPPGLQPHPWREGGGVLGNPFAHAFVTPHGFTVPDTVGVARELAYCAAWRWYDIRLALVARGKEFEWPHILDQTDSDIERRMNHRVLMELVAAADRADGLG